jgi:hypothetical protein
LGLSSSGWRHRQARIHHRGCIPHRLNQKILRPLDYGRSAQTGGYSVSSVSFARGGGKAPRANRWAPRGNLREIFFLGFAPHCILTARREEGRGEDGDEGRSDWLGWKYEKLVKKGRHKILYRRLVSAPSVRFYRVSSLESENPSFESENPISILESERPNFESEKPMEFQVRRPQVKSIAGASRGDMQPFYNVPFQFQSHS